MESSKLQELLNVPGNDRDDQWEESFFKELSSAPLRIAQEEPITGPDSWPYLLAETDSEEGEPIDKIIHWLSTRGIGLVINAEKSIPDYVFSYGMLWHYRETGLYFLREELGDDDVFAIESGQKIKAGAPSEEYLPSYVRNILKDFFVQQGVLSPKLLVMSVDGENYDLAFSLEALGNPPEEEHQGVLEALSWFLPPHYRLLLISEEGLPDFYAL